MFLQWSRSGTSFGGLNSRLIKRKKSPNNRKITTTEQPFVDIHVKSLLTKFLPLSMQQFTLIRKSIGVNQTYNSPIRSSIVLPTHNDGMVTQHTKYNFKNIPTDFMNTDDTYSEICSIINKFEVIKQDQKCINDIQKMYIMSFVIP
jgi:hypothetical protein